MCDYTEMVIYSIYAIVSKTANKYEPSDILCGLTTEQRYSVFEALGKMSVASYIENRVERGDMDFNKANKLYLTSKGTSLLHQLKAIVDEDPQWLVGDEYLNPAQQQVACA